MTDGRFFQITPEGDIVWEDVPFSTAWCLGAGGSKRLGSGGHVTFRIAVAEIDATNYFVSLDGLEIGSASPRLSASVVSHAETRQKSMLQQSLDFVEMARLTNPAPFRMLRYIRWPATHNPS